MLNSLHRPRLWLTLTEDARIFLNEGSILSNWVASSVSLKTRNSLLMLLGVLRRKLTRAVSSLLADSHTEMQSSAALRQYTSDEVRMLM